MPGKRGRSLLVSLPLIAAAACGGSVSGGPGADSGAESGSDGPSTMDGGVQPESSTMDGGNSSDAPTTDAPEPLPSDGTTGKKCASDADCQPPNGPGVARCSTSVFAPQQYYPDAVCILPTCSPVSGQTLHFCDGPDAPSSPGICVPNGQQGGICLPKCTYDKNGGMAAGCVGKDTCWSYTTGSNGGVGYCWAGCTSDGDCSGGQKCQTDEGLCELGITPPTKMFGAACTKTDTQNGVCNCLYGNMNTGYCSSFCVVGGPACPMGATCDALEYRQLGFSTQNAGMAGYCTSTCASGDAGPSCPAAATCTNIFAAGPDCIP
jgi:hypothetical protein